MKYYAVHVLAEKYYATSTKFACITCRYADPDTPPSHRTFNTLCHYIGICPAKARERMQPWVDSHIDWVKMVTEHFLAVRK